MSNLDILFEAARDPAVDAAQLAVLSQAQEALRLEESRIRFHIALAALSGRIAPVPKAGVVQVRDKGGRVISYRYSRLEDIDSMLRPLMAEYGFSLSFSTAHTDIGMLVTGVLMHISGYSRTAEIIMPSDRGFLRNELQAIGSSLYYARRYLTELLLNLVRGGQDDDGVGAYDTPTSLTAEQVAQIEGLIEVTHTETQRFLTVMTPYARQISDILASDFRRLLNALYAKERLLKEREEREEKGKANDNS